MDKLARLLEARHEWQKRGQFLNKMPIYKHEECEYFSTYYRVLSWYENQIAMQYELETEDSVSKVEVKKLQLKAEKI